MVKLRPKVGYYDFFLNMIMIVLFIATTGSKGEEK